MVVAGDYQNFIGTIRVSDLRIPSVAKMFSSSRRGFKFKIAGFQPKSGEWSVTLGGGRHFQIIDLLINGLSAQIFWPGIGR